MVHCKIGALLGVLCSVAILACPGNALGGQVSPAVLWRGQVADLTLQKAAPAGRIIASQEEFTKLWKAWLPGQDAPRVDFDTYRVVVDTSDESVLNWHGYYQAEGEVKGLIGIDRDKKVKGFSYLIGVFPRELVEAAQKKRPDKDDK